MPRFHSIFFPGKLMYFSCSARLRKDIQSLISSIPLKRAELTRCGNRKAEITSHLFLDVTPKKFSERRKDRFFSGRVGVRVGKGQ
jgi:hypothetical protein